MPQEFSRLIRLFAVCGSLSVLAACGGGGGGDGGSTGGAGPGPGPGAGTVTVSGKITFDRLVFNTTEGTGLNGNAPVESPAREVLVEAVDAGTNGVLATATTDANGDYSVSVGTNRTIFIRAKAQMQKTGAAPTWNFRVVNNTNSGALYALEGSSFNTGTAASTRNLRAASGWNGTNYDSSASRTAAPFAILDTVYRAKQLILGATATAAFPALNLYWSTQNKTSISSFCPNTGDIGTSFYIGDGGFDSCTTAGAALPSGIYILGFFASGSAGDTDEFDSSVIAHEFGHYIEDRFGRSDSIGGSHSANDRLDLRVAFGEGWGNAFMGMANNDPVYRDSSNGISQNFFFSVETHPDTTEGWYSEASVAEFLWDVFDPASAAEPADTVALGFGPIFSVMTGAQVTTTAYTSIFSFATALKSANAAQASAIDDLLNAEDIHVSNAFGTTETNNAGIASLLPVYVDIPLNSVASNVCSRSNFGNDGSANKLGNRRFLRFENSQTRTVNITINGVASGSVANSIAATDPDIFIIRQGQLVTSGESENAGTENVNTQLPAGTYILEVYDFDVTDNTDTRPRCMTVSIQG